MLRVLYRRLAIAVSCALLLTISLPVLMAPQAVFAQSSTVSINPTQGPPSTNVTGTGSNWTAGDQMQVSWADDGSILANTTVQSDGTFTVGFTIPSSAGLGGHDIYFTDLSSRYFLVAVFTVGTVDLQTLSIVALQPPAFGTSPTFRANIRNNGTVASGFFNIQWIADGKNYYGGHYSIPAGAVDTHDFIWSKITAGKHTLTFIANYDHLVPETNYNNNKVTITFMVTGWGIDSSGFKITASDYSSVQQTFGTPDFWGRYIGDPLTSFYDNTCTQQYTTIYNWKNVVSSEVTTARGYGLPLLPIYFNYPETAVNGSSSPCGSNYAKAAIEFAQHHSGTVIGKGTAIFVDIEQAAGVQPDAAFIKEWYDEFNMTFTYTSPYDGKQYTYQAGYYKAGYYANTLSSANFDTPYCAAVSQEPKIGTNSFIWTTQPNPGRTTKNSQPVYAPIKPPCANKTYAWQYGVQDGGGPPAVDTDEIGGNLPLWHP